MNFLLDANAWIAHLRQTSRTVTERLAQYPSSEVVLCSVVLAELYYGVERSSSANRAINLALVDDLRRQYVSLPFDDRAAERYGQVRAYLAGLGTPIGPNDLMIAAIALANGSTVVTHNSGEFGRVPGLMLEDWQIP
jgi:tRNA(fMet)-specific endonuclease VapC